jgi:hypothetical protein
MPGASETIRLGRRGTVTVLSRSSRTVIGKAPLEVSEGEETSSPGWRVQPAVKSNRAMVIVRGMRDEG